MSIRQRWDPRPPNSPPQADRQHCGRDRVGVQFIGLPRAAAPQQAPGRGGLGQGRLGICNGRAVVRDLVVHVESSAQDAESVRLQTQTHIHPHTRRNANWDARSWKKFASTISISGLHTPVGKGVWVAAMSLDGGTRLAYAFINDPRSPTRYEWAHCASIPSQISTTLLISRSCHSTCVVKL